MREHLNVEAANNLLMEAPITPYKVAGDGVGRRIDGTVKIYNATPSAGKISEYVYETNNFKAYLKIYRFWKSSTGYTVKIDINTFNDVVILLNKGTESVPDNIEMINNLKSFFNAAHLDVLNDSTPTEGSSHAFTMQFVASL